MTASVELARARARLIKEVAEWYAKPGNGAPGELDHALAVELPSYAEEILAALDGAVLLRQDDAQAIGLALEANMPPGPGYSLASDALARLRAARGAA